MQSRGKPFSGKKKKEQLQEKRQKKREKVKEENEQLAKETSKEETHAEPESGPVLPPTATSHGKKLVKKEIEEEAEDEDEEEISGEEQDEDEEEGSDDDKPKTAVSKPKREKERDLRTVFERESTEEVERRRREALKPLNLEKREQPWSVLTEYLTADPIDMPKRPANLKGKTQEEAEEEGFQAWLSSIYKNNPKDRLNYFEHNLEKLEGLIMGQSFKFSGCNINIQLILLKVWRQLWRTCERSDVVMLITDARFPLFHFPPALYNYVIKNLRKPLLLVLNKQDLVEPKVIEAWKMYFNQHYPELKIVCFNSFTIFEKDINPDKKRKMSNKRRKYATSVGRRQLLDAIKSMNLKKGGQPVVIDYTEIEQKEKELQIEEESDEEEENETQEASITDKAPEQEGSNSNTITMGCVGHPNVGKSSLINGLMGTKVVSASRTPGHTKHLQTIYLTKQIILCDCPGLVFPALDRPKPLQILCGLFPIAQVRESFSAIRYLAERVPLEKILGLQHPDPEEKYWSPYYIAEAYAIKRGYFLKKGRADVHRAGLEILRDCVDGVISISWPPPGIDMTLVPDPIKQKKEVFKTQNTKPDDKEEVLSEEEDVVISKAQGKKLKKKFRKQKELQHILDDEEQPVELNAILKQSESISKEKSKNSKEEEWNDRFQEKMRKKHQ